MRRVLLAATLGLSVAGLTACGGDGVQDGDEKSETYKIDVISATFPGRQYLGAKSKLNMEIENADSRAIPDLTITIDGFDKRLGDPNLADPERPIWVLDSPPKNSSTAYTNTFTVGRLDPGATRKLTWNLTAVRPGTYTVRYQVAGGLYGKAKAEAPDGGPVKGSLLVRITSKPRPVPDPIT